MCWEPSRYLLWAAEGQQQMAMAAHPVPALLPNMPRGFSVPGTHNMAQMPGQNGQDAPVSRQLLLLSPPRLHQQSSAQAGCHSATWHCASTVPLDVQFAAGVRAAVRTAGHLGSGARLAAPTAQPQRQSTVFELSSCPGPEPAGRLPARWAAWR